MTIFGKSHIDSINDQIDRYTTSKTPLGRYGVLGSHMKCAYFLQNSVSVFRILENGLEFFRMSLECLQNVIRVSLECLYNVFRMSSESLQNVFRMSLECLQNVFRILKVFQGSLEFLRVLQNVFRMSLECLQNVFKMSLECLQNLESSLEFFKVH